jgi:hypothetical protein
LYFSPLPRNRVLLRPKYQVYYLLFKKHSNSIFPPKHSASKFVFSFTFMININWCFKFSL